ncbi:non-ribosomal peptide synthetase [Tengunoibacter tsumagoiensis]|uniref:Carrier domain-containing protein n=1 Tax=Tengunoibacter tsumagoiensis TaxID=2014871 RepID=A0A402A3A0_9CHLR|nr:non-ribosomal peptide synthetase [Tengunoibacter tsumagoiensis]GCE13519.1 hypothetical protein KTT_33780 [Tengunoibacter tsumagoiensis]
MNDLDALTEDEDEEREALLALLLAEDGFDTAVVQTIRPRQEQGPAPLSFAQERLWFLDQLMPNLSAYTIPVGLRINGALHIPALSQSLNEIVRRHEVLRTRFDLQDGQPVQIVEATLQITPRLIDLSTLPTDVKARTTTYLATQEARLPFDMAHGPLLRTSLLQLDGQEFLLLLTMHHVVSDGWSMSIFYRELAALYEAFSSGIAPSLPPLPIQYSDFAVWQRNWLESDAQEALNYWRQHLKNAPAILNLPTDRPRPAIQTFSGSVESLMLNTQLTMALRTLSQREEVTLFMTLLAAWQTLLWRYTDQDDICVGTFIAGRTHAETEGLIGFFINNLVLRTDLSGNPTFQELLRRVREVTLGAYAHQEIPFEKILQDLGRNHDLSITPLFQVMLILQNMPEPIPALADLTLRETGVGNTRANFDLSLWVTESRDHLQMSLQYNTDLFDAQTIRRMLDHLSILLQGIVAHPQQQLSTLPILTDIEQQHYLSPWQNDNQTASQRRCLHHLFEEQVLHTPDTIALVYEQEQLTYATLNQRANQLAIYLRTVGVGPEVNVGICLPRCTALIVGLLSILKAGGAYVPLDPTYPQDRLALMVQDAHIHILLTQTALKANFPRYAGTVIDLDADWAIIGDKSSPDLENAATAINLTDTTVTALNLAYTMYTSGSTGRPKGVAIQHHSVVNFIESARTVYTMTIGDRTLQFASINFDISVEEIYATLTSGATLVLRNDAMLSSIPFFLDVCHQWGITILDLPTAFWHEMAAHSGTIEPSLLTRLRLVIIGGEQVQTEKLSLWQQHVPASIQLVNTYGPTETTVIATLQVVDATQPPEHNTSIGRALTNVQVAILDRFQQPVPIGVWGELIIGGAGLARGYPGYPALTAEKFRPNPFGNRTRVYQSGDRARFLSDGTIEFGGRLDNQVKLRGFRVEPGEIETAIRLFPNVYDTVVCVYEERPGEKQLVAYVVWKDAQLSTIYELQASLKGSLPQHMLPAFFLVLEKLPLMPNGKVDRRALPPPANLSSLHTQELLVGPRDPLEYQLVQIWEECLHRHPIGVTENFFEIGGHSLLAVRLLSQIQKHFARALPLSALFQGATIEQLASTLRNQSNVVSVLIGIQTEGPKRPLFLMHPTGGNVLCYAGLAQHLGKDQPLYGLQAQGLNPEEAPLSSIEEMATVYIKAIRSQQPEGPYLLGGWSSGGLIAVEVASQLREQGQQVALLALLDTPALFTREQNSQDSPETINQDAVILARFVSQLGTKSGLDLSATYTDLSQRTPEEQLLYILEQAKSAHVVPADADCSLISRLIQVYKADVRATLDYHPRVYPDRISYFQSEQSVQTGQDTLAAWRIIATGGLDLFISPGDHFGMLKEPHVQLLAAQLRACLDPIQDVHRDQ